MSTHTPPRFLCHILLTVSPLPPASEYSLVHAGTGQARPSPSANAAPPLPQKVMLVRARDVHAEAPEFKRIMVPLDGSLAAAEILPSVRELARCSGSEIVLLRVVPGEPESQIADARLPPTTRVEKTEVTGERAATDYVQTLSTSAVHWGVPVRTLVQVGDPASVILDTAQDMYVDLIAMSTHGLGGLRRFFLGSVAERVVRHAVAPVMLFRAKE